MAISFQISSSSSLYKKDFLCVLELLFLLLSQDNKIDNKIVAVLSLKCEITCTYTVSFSGKEFAESGRIQRANTQSFDHFHFCYLCAILFFAIIITDINECDTNNGNCDQICENSQGSYQCECHSGFSLQGKHKCYGKSFEYLVVNRKQSLRSCEHLSSALCIMYSHRLGTQTF